LKSEKSRVFLQGNKGARATFPKAMYLV